MRDEVVRAFPNADITWENDVKRQGIVDSWPEDVDDSAPRAATGALPRPTISRARFAIT